MKKIYQIPTTKVVKMQSMQILAGSNPDGFHGALGGDGGNGSNALSRGGSVWDDDDYDF